jgi:hypothetical protein
MGTGAAGTPQPRVRGGRRRLSFPARLSFLGRVFFFLLFDLVCMHATLSIKTEDRTQAPTRTQIDHVDAQDIRIRRLSHAESPSAFLGCDTSARSSRPRVPSGGILGRGNPRRDAWGEGSRGCAAPCRRCPRNVFFTATKKLFVVVGFLAQLVDHEFRVQVVGREAKTRRRERYERHRSHSGRPRFKVALAGTTHECFFCSPRFFFCAQPRYMFISAIYDSSWRLLFPKHARIDTLHLLFISFNAAPAVSTRWRLVPVGLGALPSCCIRPGSRCLRVLRICRLSVVSGPGRLAGAPWRAGACRFYSAGIPRLLRAVDRRVRCVLRHGPGKGAGGVDGKRFWRAFASSQARGRAGEGPRRGEIASTEHTW